MLSGGQRHQLGNARAHVLTHARLHLGLEGRASLDKLKVILKFKHLDPAWARAEALLQSGSQSAGAKGRHLQRSRTMAQPLPSALTNSPESNRRRWSALDNRPHISPSA